MASAAQLNRTVQGVRRFTIDELRHLRLAGPRRVPRQRADWRARRSRDRDRRLRPEWPRRFEAERDRTAGRRRRSRAADRAHRIDCGASTSPPSRSSMCSWTVADVSDEASYGPASRRPGYELRVREPEHRMFRTPPHDVHVHVWRDSDPEVYRHLAFRDRLRHSANDLSAYERIKCSLARAMDRHERLCRCEGARDPGDPGSCQAIARSSRAIVRGRAVAALLGDLGYPTDVDAPPRRSDGSWIATTPACSYTTTAAGRSG